MTDLAASLKEWSQILRHADLLPDPTDTRVPDLLDEAAAELSAQQAFIDSITATALQRADAAEREVKHLRAKLIQAEREISWQDVRLAAGEGPLTAADVLAGCNAELVRRSLHEPNNLHVVQSDQVIIDRIGLNDDDTLDEIVLTGTAHLEQMTAKSWFLNLTRSDGSSVAVFLHAGRGRLVATFEERGRALLAKLKGGEG